MSLESSVLSYVEIAKNGKNPFEFLSNILVNVYKTPPSLRYNTTILNVYSFHSGTIVCVGSINTLIIAQFTYIIKLKILQTCNFNRSSPSIKCLSTKGIASTNSNDLDLDQETLLLLFLFLCTRTLQTPQSYMSTTI